MSVPATYPLRVDAELDPALSRWLWLVKWILAIPHFIVLAFLWIAYPLMTVVAFFAILFTGRYPQPIFEFNVGVLRWTWRVAYYTFGANGTDRYPPFSLAEVADYPTHLDVAYPSRLSRGLVLVKWWLLAIPHYIVVALLAGGAWFAWRAGGWAWWPGSGLIGILVLIAAVTLAVTGRYPKPLFDLVLGMNRWVLRVAAYTGLMTDEYPPFRLDMGGPEPGGTVTIPPSAGGGGSSAATPSRPDAATPAMVEPRGRGWTGGRITSLVIGSVLALASLGVLAGGGFTLWLDRTQRDAQGFISTGTTTYTTTTFALTTRMTVGRDWGTRWLHIRGAAWFYGPGASDTLRIRAGSLNPDRAVFVGIAPTAAVDEYLAGAARTEITNLTEPTYRAIGGSPPAGPPTAATIWSASSVGTGTRSIEWPIQTGSWSVVVMNADATQGVAVTADAAAKIPSLPWITAGLFIGGGALLLGAALLIAIPIRRAAREA